MTADDVFDESQSGIMPFWLKDTQSKIFVWETAAVVAGSKVAVGSPSVWPVLQLRLIKLRLKFLPLLQGP